MKAGQTLHFLAVYKFKSVFFRIFAMLIVLTLLVVGGFYLFLSSYVYNELERRVYDANIDILSKTENTFGIVLDYVDQIVTATAQSPNVISAVISPGLDKTARNFALVKYLCDTAANTEMIDNITLYVDYDRTVFSSNGVATGVDSYGDKLLIEGYHSAHVSAQKNLSGETTTTLHLLAGRLCLIRDFPLPSKNRNGVLIFEINQEIMLDKVMSSEEGGKIYVYDECGNAAFPKSRDYSSLTFDMEKFMRAEEGVGLLSGIGQDSMRSAYYFRSPATGWFFVHPVDFSGLRNVYLDTLKLMIPIILTSLLLCAAFSVWVIHSIYQPILKLIALVAGESEKGEPAMAKNEFELLDVAYADAINAKEKLGTLVQRSTETILAKLFFSAISGHNLQTAELKDTLASLDTAFSPDQKYAAVLLKLQHKQDELINRVQTDLYRVSADSFLKKLDIPGLHVFCFSTDSGSIVVILSFDAQASKPVATLLRNRAAGALRDCFRDMPLGVLVGCGNIYNTLQDLGYSYREALEVLQYHVYDGKAAENSVLLLPAEGADDSTYLATRINQFVQSLTAYADSATNELADRIFRDITSMAKDDQGHRDLLEQYMDAIYSVIVSTHIDHEVEIPPREVVRDTLQNAQNAAQMEDLARVACMQIIEAFQIYNSKKSSKYVLLAKEHIQKNYYNSALSLNDVAERINITPSYLSKIFKLYQGQNFLDYLNEFRVKKAKSYIDTTNLPVKEIGFKCGFNTAQNFIRVFKKYVGLPPGQYRGKNL